MDIRLECSKLLGAGLATISLVGAGTGVGVVFGSLLIGFSRNPNLKDQLFQYAILGFALTEAVGLLGLMMAWDRFLPTPFSFHFFSFLPFFSLFTISFSFLFFFLDETPLEEKLEQLEKLLKEQSNYLQLILWGLLGFVVISVGFEISSLLEYALLLLELAAKISISENELVSLIEREVKDPIKLSHLCLSQEEHLATLKRKLALANNFSYYQIKFLNFFFSYHRVSDADIFHRIRSLDDFFTFYEVIKQHLSSLKNKI